MSMTIKQLAIKSAHVTDGNAEFLAAQADATVTAMKNKVSSYVLFLDLREVHGKALDMFPVPGSEGGNNPDKFKDIVNGQETDTSFWNIYADNTEYATKVLPGIDMSGFMATLAAIEGGQEPYASMSDPDKADAKTFARQRRDANRRSINTAAKIHFQKLAVEEWGGKSIEVTFKTETDKDGTVTYDTRTTTPICVGAIGEGSDRSEYVRLSVGEFLQLNMTKAQANFDAGGVSKWKAIKKSGGKGAKGKGKGKGDAVDIGKAGIKTFEAFEGAMAAVVNYMGGDGLKEDNIAGYDKIMSKLATLKGDDRKKLVHTIGTVCNAFDAVYTEIEAEYRAVVQEMVRANAPSKAA